MRILRSFLARLGYSRGPARSAEAPEARARRELMAELASTREQVLARVRMLHPETNCLPVPNLRVPAHDGQLPYVEHYAISIGANLLDQDTTASRRWQDACQECPHTDRSIVDEIYGLLWQWYRLMLAADRLIVIGGYRAVREFAWSLADVREFIADMPTRSYPTAEIQSTTTAALHDGAEFSLDGGTTWHVLAMRDTILDALIVYTGEHDAEGYPNTAYEWDLRANQPCLTHVGAVLAGPGPAARR